MQTSCLNVIKAKANPEAMKAAKNLNNELLIYIYHVMENSKNNSNFNFSTKPKINMSDDFNMQSLKSRSATTKISNTLPLNE